MRPSHAIAIVALMGCAPTAGLTGLPIESDLSTGRATATGSFDHAGWGSILHAAARPDLGRVDYARVDRAQLDAYIGRLADAPIDTLGAAEQEALLINAYNAFTVKLILDQPTRPASIKDLSDPWGSKHWTIGGHTLSLDDIEHHLLRPLYKDPRLHFALNCASVGCPPLQNQAWAAATIDAQLEAATLAALSMPRHAELRADGLHVTKLMDWYGDDFSRAGWSPVAESIPAWVAAHGPPPLSQAISAAGGQPDVHFADYDWALNQLTAP